MCLLQLFQQQTYPAGTHNWNNNQNFYCHWIKLTNMVQPINKHMDQTKESRRWAETSSMEEMSLQNKYEENWTQGSTDTRKNQR